MQDGSSPTSTTSPTLSPNPEIGRIRLERESAYKLKQMISDEVKRVGESRREAREQVPDIDTRPWNREQHFLKRMMAEVDRLIAEKDW
jgi:hypothetical protein